ncbi:hypothetical protein KY289_000681 [Solanum tuberosum]|nr:hypothetical protein KY289_000681 [Solanum tuberosum]
MKYGRDGNHDPQSKTYRLYNPTSGKVIISRNVVFNEEAAWEWNDKEEDSVIHILAHAEVGHTWILETTSFDLSSPGSSNTDHTAHGSSNNSTPSSSRSPPSASSSETPPTKFRSLQDVYASCSFVVLAAEPTCYEEAANQPEWQDAMIEEIQAIEKNQTWELVDLPEGKNVIRLK